MSPVFSASMIAFGMAYYDGKYTDAYSFVMLGNSRKKLIEIIEEMLEDK